VCDEQHRNCFRERYEDNWFVSVLHHHQHEISSEEYLELELTSEIRHEYLAGQIYAMAGVTTAHNFIAGDIFAALHAHLAGKPCTAFIGDVKVRIELRGEDWFYYPDVFVNCDPAGEKPSYCETPCIIFEVLSPSTQRTDEREKFLVYQALPSLQVYVLVAQDQREVRAYRKTNGWTRETYPQDGPALPLPEIDFVLPLDAIYARAEARRSPGS
jgi:Uma2 family endonuclease